MKSVNNTSLIKDKVNAFRNIIHSSFDPIIQVHPTVPGLGPCKIKKYKFQSDYRYPSQQKKRSLDALSLNFNDSGNLMRGKGYFRVKPFTGLIYNKQNRAQVGFFEADIIDLETQRYHLYLNLVFNEIKTIFANGGFSPVDRKINSLIALGHCEYQIPSRRILAGNSSGNNNGMGSLGVPMVNMTTTMIDNIHGSDFDNFSPSSLEQ